MEQHDIEDAAMFLLHLRTQRDQVRGMPGELAPKTLDDAYEIQDATHRFAGWPIGMLKVGCTSDAARNALGIPHPIGGRIPRAGIFESGAVVPREFLASEPFLECEIAMRVDAGGQVDAIAPAIELVNARFTDTSRVAGASLIADNSVGCGVVIGALKEPADVDLDGLAMTLQDAGGEIASGSIAALVDGPDASVHWMLRHEAERGRSVEAGTWIITGTCTGLTPTSWGGDYRADFAALGQVTFSLGS